MPTTLTRSLLVVVLPGLLALLPWALWFASRMGGFDDIYEKFPTLVHGVLVALGVLIGSIGESEMTKHEYRWDEELEDKYQVQDNWYAYLADEHEHEPVGFRYISRRVTTMYFELAMSWAAPLAILGTAGFYQENFAGWALIATFALIALAIGANLFFKRCAKQTHDVLCRIRQELIKRMEQTRSVASTSPVAVR